MSRGAQPHRSPTAGLGADSSHPAETLGALASVFSIWVVTAALVYLAAARIISNDYEIEAQAMLATSASAVGINLVYVLRRAACSCVPPCTPARVLLPPAPPSPPMCAHYTPRPPALAPRSPSIPVQQPHVPKRCPCPRHAPAFQLVYIHPLAPQAAPPQPYPMHSRSPTPELLPWPHMCPQPYVSLPHTSLHGAMAAPSLLCLQPCPTLAPCPTPLHPCPVPPWPTLPTRTSRQGQRAPCP